MAIADGAHQVFSFGASRDRYRDSLEGRGSGMKFARKPNVRLKLFASLSGRLKSGTWGLGELLHVWSLKPSEEDPAHSLKPHSTAPASAAPSSFVGRAIADLEIFKLFTQRCDERK